MRLQSPMQNPEYERGTEEFSANCGTSPAHLLRPPFGASSRASRTQPADIIDNPRASVQCLPFWLRLALGADRRARLRLAAKRHAVRAARGPVSA
jgi:hypothetical protein